MLVGGCSSNSDDDVTATHAQRQPPASLILVASSHSTDYYDRSMSTDNIYSSNNGRMLHAVLSLTFFSEQQLTSGRLSFSLNQYEREGEREGEHGRIAPA